MTHSNRWRWTPWILLAALLAAPAVQAAGPMPDFGEGAISEALNDGRTMYWRMLVEHEAVVLNVQTPCGPWERLYKKGEEIVFAPAEEVYPDDPDGIYTWQVRIVPVIDSAVRKELERARAEGDDEAVANLRRKGLLPQGPFIQTGAFRVQDGALVAGGEEEKEQSPSKLETAIPTGSTGAAAVTGDLEVVTGADVVYNDDLIIRGSLCVGFDCINGEVFSFDTIRLKENNLRIKFEDTSGGTFPSRDWEIEANSSTNGGQSHFRINDVDGARSPFTIEAAAPSHSLYVDSSGRIGRKTANPVLELHLVDGDTPAIRLEQDTSSGFGAQVWDVAGNETNFFVRDATGGSTLPFRIRPGASSNRLVIGSDGNIGIGTSSPARPLDVIAAGAPDNTVLEIENNGPARMRINNAATGEVWNIGHQTPAGSGLVFSDVGDPTSEMLLDVNGNMTIAGSLTTAGGLYPDYVFEPGYRLMPIPELATFIAENGHLPRVPTAGDVSKRGGVNMSELQLLLLEKVEELTLYTVEQHQIITELRARLEALETKPEVVTAP